MNRILAIKKKILKIIMNKLEMIQFTIKVIKEDGVLGLYNGMTSSIFGSVVQYSIYFSLLKLSTYLFQYLRIGTEGITKNILLSLISAIFTAILTNPIWVVNARMANKHKICI